MNNFNTINTNKIQKYICRLKKSVVENDKEKIINYYDHLKYHIQLGGNENQKDSSEITKTINSIDKIISNIISNITNEQTIYSKLNQNLNLNLSNDLKKCNDEKKELHEQNTKLENDLKELNDKLTQNKNNLEDLEKIKTKNISSLNDKIENLNKEKSNYICKDNIEG